MDDSCTGTVISYNTSYSLVDTSIVYNCGMVSVTLQL
jgi:hypothetical protein